MPFDPTSGFAQVVPFGLEEYLGLVDTMGRAVHPSKRVAILASRHPCLGPRPSSAALPAWSGGSQEGVRNQSCVRMRGILSPIGL